MNNKLSLRLILGLLSLSMHLISFGMSRGPQLAKQQGLILGKKTNFKEQLEKKQNYKMSPDLVNDVQGLLNLKPIMPQQQLWAQKDALQEFVKSVWTDCLKALGVKFPGVEEENWNTPDLISVKVDFEK